MTAAPTPSANAAEVILSYHQRTKHRLERYAAGPETLDWSEQPNPFREYSGSARILLPLGGDALKTTFSDIYAKEHGSAAPLALDSLGILLQLSLALAAWKEYGPDRWAVRCAPSSGNLHPTEAYVLARNIEGLTDGVHHYVSLDHSLELRRTFAATAKVEPQLWIGLSSIHWREAWKYGERAFRYCQLDVGHAIGALRYAAGVLGWKAEMLESLGSRDVAALLGLDRNEDYAGGAEREAPDLILRIGATPGVSRLTDDEPGVFAGEGASDWQGRANILDRHPMYKWPVIDEASAATRKTAAAPEPRHRVNYPPIGLGSPEPAAGVILGRRSAQGFDRSASMGSGAFYHLIDRLLARNVAPWDVWSYAPRIHPIFFIHRVDGLEPGVYALVRNPDAAMRLRQAMRPEFLWKRPEHVPPQLDFYQLLPGDCAKAARTLNCHQAIASDGCFALGMLCEFEEIVRGEPWRYKQLHWEAGLLGHVLYLEAETLGFRGTGIGCYFDDSLHEILGLKDAAFASLYHFTVGRALVDARISTLPPYANRNVANQTHPEAQGSDAKLGGMHKGEAAMAEEASFERIGVEAARALIDAGDALVLDMRDPGSYDGGHIDGAEHVTEANIFNFLSGTPKDKPVLIYCYHGNASQVYAKTFADFRFTKVYSLDGGYEGWRQRGA
ncbi:rhodanese-like domain-containing protein [Methylocapsa acidiphila]|uniref:rhodanese-like domain-containing protein n=1 Tax=Methylocapsa acidiphila TaxID=133552 RepID=UPI0004186695